MILHINIDEGEASIKEALNGSASDVISQCRETTGSYHSIPARVVETSAPIVRDDDIRTGPTPRPDHHAI